MADFLPSLGALLCTGSSGAATKDAVHRAGRYRAITYSYVIAVALMAAVALVLGIPLALPSGGLLLPFVAEVAIGAAGILAYFKAMEHGRASVLGALSSSYVLLVMALGVLLLGETLSLLQVAGALVIIMAAMAVGMEGASLRFEKGSAYIAITIVCWAYYFSFIKTFVAALGAYGATVALEAAIMVLVAAYYAARKKDISPSAIGWQAVLLCGLLHFGTALLYSFSVEAIGVALTAAVMAGGPIVNAAAAALLLGERLDAHKYAAIAMMALGLAALAL